MERQIHCHPWAAVPSYPYNPQHDAKWLQIEITATYKKIVMCQCTAVLNTGTATELRLPLPQPRSLPSLVPPLPLLQLSEMELRDDGGLTELAPNSLASDRASSPSPSKIIGPFLSSMFSQGSLGPYFGPSAVPPFCTPCASNFSIWVAHGVQVLCPNQMYYDVPP